MKAQHTPGPWHWQTDSTEVASCSVREANGRMIARLLSRAPKKGYPPDFETMKSDARLIAAAPDLLAAAEVIVVNALDIDGQPDRCSITYEQLHNLMAALAKVQGEG